VKTYKFELVIEAGRGGGAWVTIPLDIREEFGKGGQVKVNAAFDGEPYRGSLAPMDDGFHVLGVRKAIRRAIGKDVGDTVTVTIEQDMSRRTVSLPAELRTALNRSKTAKIVFAKLSYTSKREYADWVAEGEQNETRKRRAKKAIAKILKTGSG